MTTLDATIAATTKRLEQQLRRKAIADYAAKERERKAARRADADNRRADAHRKIQLGGLVICAGVEEWNEAEIVGALLYAAAHIAKNPETRKAFLDRGVIQMEERERARKATRVR